MHHHLPIAPAAVIGFALVTWVLAGLAQGPGAFAQAPASDGHDPHAHHHHPAPASVRRTQASYPIPDVTLVDQAGSPVILRDLLNTCQAACDYIPRRSYPLFLAREELRLLRAEARCARQAARTPSTRSTRRLASHASKSA